MNTRRNASFLPQNRSSQGGEMAAIWEGNKNLVHQVEIKERTKGKGGGVLHSARGPSRSSGFARNFCSLDPHFFFS